MVSDIDVHYLPLTSYAGGPSSLVKLICNVIQTSYNVATNITKLNIEQITLKGKRKTNVVKYYKISDCEI